MPLRKIILANEQTYHILNRGINSQPIFTSRSDYSRFISLINYYQYSDVSLSFSHYIRLAADKKEELLRGNKSTNQPLVTIFAFCLMPNHFHILLRQEKDNGIRKMMSNVQNAYGKYFNTKNDRHGPLFESRFKGLRIETDETFLHVSRYIHLNPATSYLVEFDELSSYEWSSYPEYLGLKKGFTNTSQILALAGGIGRYKEFVCSQVDYQRELNKIKHLGLE